jgi:hypothetical protein
VAAVPPTKRIDALWPQGPADLESCTRGLLIDSPREVRVAFSGPEVRGSTGHLIRQFPAYNLDIRSSVEIPGLGPVAETVSVKYEAFAPPRSAGEFERFMPVFSGLGADSHGIPGLRCYRFPDGVRGMLYADGTQFLINDSADQVAANWVAPYTLEDTAIYFLGPVLGTVLRLQGHVCLHASVIAFNGRAVVFMGDAGSGKSTLAAAFATLGHAVLSEDVACLERADDEFRVAPGYPRIRLWDSSARLLFGAATSLPLLTPNWEKRYLDLTLPPYRFHRTSLPLGAIFVVKERMEMIDAVQFGRLEGQGVLLNCLGNTYGGRLLDSEMRAHEFEVLGAVARSIPVEIVNLNSDGTYLARACDEISRRAEILLG